MSRDIKFRQRNINNGSWYYWGYIDGEWSHPLNQDNYCNPELSDQCTGLKDRNGKEIYEGDRWKRDSFIGIVEFKFGGWQFTKAKDSGCYQYPAFHSNADSGEVIGNIYENPELSTEAGN
jgi:uncharacterized phage protein (TIGR01671 family)